jgi:hypothetical protein
MSQEEFQAESIEEAVEQASDHVGFARPKKVKGKSGRVWVIPNPALLSPDQQKRHDQMKIDLDKQLDRFPDALDGAGKFLGRGAIKEPYQINGDVVGTYEEFLMQAIYGDEFDAAVEDGLYPSYFGLFWTEMNVRLAEKRAADSKSS